MALQIDFLSLDWSNPKYRYPNWDGPMKCPQCGGNAYSMGGFSVNLKKLTYHSECFDCKWEDKDPDWDRRNEGYNGAGGDENRG